ARSLLVTAITATLALAMPLHGGAQQVSPIAGAWTLNRSLSEMPREIGFNPNWFPPPTSTGRTGSTSSGGRGRRGSSSGGNAGGAPFSAPRSESYDDSRRLQLLTAEARNPPARLIIVDTPAAVTMTNELGQ